MLIYVYTVDNQDFQGILKEYYVGLDAYNRNYLICSRIVCRTAFYVFYLNKSTLISVNMVSRDKCLHNFGEANLGEVVLMFHDYLL
jgi:hypothetical protein